jgi:hypothetical protein
MEHPFALTYIYTIRWHLFWAIGSCLIATIHWSGIYYQYDAIKWWLLDILLASYIMVKSAGCQQIELSKYAFVVIGFILWCLLSAFWASHAYGAIETGIRYALIATSIYFLSREVKSGNPKNLILISVIASCLTFFVVVIVERYALKLPYDRPNHTPLGFINHAGHIYVIWIPILFWGMFKLAKIGSALCATLLLATLTILVDSAIRASIVGLGIACCVIAIAVFKNRQREALQLLGILGLLITTILVVSFTQKNDAALNTKIARVVDAPDLNYASTDRIIMYKNTLTMIADNPFGVGLNNFEYIHPLYGQPGTPNASPFMNEVQILKQPHNFYLKLLSELGWFGGAILLILIIGLLRSALCRKNSEIQWNYAYLLALLATFFNAFFCAVFSNPASLWFFVILASAYLGITKTSATYLTLNVTQSARILCCTFAAIFIGLSCANLISQKLAKDGFQTQNRIKLQRAVKIYPGNERAWFDLAITLFEQNNKASEAVTAMHQFLSLYPYHIGARYKITQWYCFQRDFINCRAEALQLIGYYPAFKPVQQLYLQASEELRRSQ